MCRLMYVPGKLGWPLQNDQRFLRLPALASPLCLSFAQKERDGAKRSRCEDHGTRRPLRRVQPAAASAADAVAAQLV